MHPISLPSMILILVVALLIFGPSKLPELGKAVGETFKSFREAMAGKAVEETHNISSEDQGKDKDKLI